MNRITSRLASSFGLALLASMFMVAASSQAAIILSDDFSTTTLGAPATPGSQPDTAKWDPAAPAAIFGGGATEATLDGTGTFNAVVPSGANQAIVANTAYNSAPSALQNIRLTVDLTSFAQSGLFGLHDFAGDSLQIRDDILGNWVLWSIVGGSITGYDTGISTGATAGNTGVWTIDWTTTHAVVSLNGTPVVDTATTTPYTGSAQSPTAALRPFVYNYNGSAAVDSVLYESISLSVPEPASLSLLGAASLLVMRRRRA